MGAVIRNLRRAFAACWAMTLTACTPSLHTFNQFTPHDGGAVQAAHDAPYGADARQKLDAYAPRGAASAPMVVFIYGGSWANGDRGDYAFVGDALAARGFVTIIPDYRLYPHVRFPAFLEDCAAAVRWARDHAKALGADPDRIVLMGHSAGAYNAMMLALDPRYLHDVGVDAHVIKGVAGLSGPYDFYPFDVQATRDTFGAAPKPQLTQPIRFVGAAAPPVFMAWGEDDDLVGRQNILNMARALRKTGAAPEVKLYSKLGHVSMLLALSLPLRGRAPVLADVIAFARRVTAR